MLDIRKVFKSINDVRTSASPTSKIVAAGPCPGVSRPIAWDRAFHSPPCSAAGHRNVASDRKRRWCQPTWHLRRPLNDCVVYGHKKLDFAEQLGVWFWLSYIYFVRFVELSGALTDTWTLLCTATVASPASGGSSHGHTEDDGALPVVDTSSAAVGSTRVSTKVVGGLAASVHLMIGR